MRYKLFRIIFYFKIVICLLIIVSSCQASEKKYKNYHLEIAEVIDTLNLDAAKVSILIDKSDYKLTVLIDTVIVKEYPVVFGGNPVDDKLMQGDKCTPEGEFNMKSKYPHKKWSKFIWIDYPNADSWHKHNVAKQEGKIPDNANIGGEIGIHGVPAGMNELIDLRINWTLGCISMKNKDIDELYPYILQSTNITIRK